MAHTHSRFASVASTDEWVRRVASRRPRRARLSQGWVVTVSEGGKLRHVMNLAHMPYELVFQVRELAGPKKDKVDDPSLRPGNSSWRRGSNVAKLDIVDEKTIRISVQLDDAVSMVNEAVRDALR